MTLKEAGVLRVGDQVILKSRPEQTFTIAEIILNAPRSLGDYYAFWLEYKEDEDWKDNPRVASHVDILRRV